MQVILPAVGTRGDVQPYVALGIGLRHAGHSVRIATLKAFEPLVTASDLEFAPLRAEFLELLDTPEGRKALTGGNPLGAFKAVLPMLRSMLDEVADASQGADVLVFHPKTLASEHVAQAQDIPAIRASVVPLYTPTAAFATPVIRGGKSMGAVLNRWSWNAFLSAVYAPYRRMIDGWRASSLGLPSMNERPPAVAETLYGYSEQIVPRPSDWPDDVVVTGSWFLDGEPGWRPPEELRRFLEDGEAVYVGFGSMPSRDPSRTGRAVVEALRAAGARAVVAGLEVAAHDAEGILSIDAAPHSWLFPRVTGVVHHGGAGTTAAGLRAGRPTLVVPTFGDQPFWGRRVAELGVGPRPIPSKKLSARMLAEAIGELLTDPTMRSNAARLGAAVSREDGVGKAVGEIERIVLGHGQRPRQRSAEHAHSADSAPGR